MSSAAKDMLGMGFQSKVVFRTRWPFAVCAEEDMGSASCY